MPFLADLTGAQPLFTSYSLQAVCSNSYISHAKAGRELGFQPRPARQAVRDAVRWFQQGEEERVSLPESMPKAAG